MAKLNVYIPPSSPERYPIFIRSQLLRPPFAWLPQRKKYSKIVIITDHRVKKLYGFDLMQSLKSLGHSVLLFSFSPGESSKNLSIKSNLEEKMLKHGCDRQTLCLALGGGVAGDLAGFIAATYMRGIDYIQIPTTCLAMIDSSVGGKTAIDTYFGKNLIGAFWHPVTVVADIDCLKSLSQKQLINGLIEAIKMYLTHDAKGFSFFKKNLNKILAKEGELLQKTIVRAVKIKAAVVAQDPQERIGPRMALNCGHTIGHAIEKITDYNVLHGYAVAYGILMEAKISQLLGILSTEDFTQLVNVFEELNIYGKDLRIYPLSPLIKATKNDKKNLDGAVRYVLLQNIGHVLVKRGQFVHPVKDSIVELAYQSLIED